MTGPVVSLDTTREPVADGIVTIDAAAVASIYSVAISILSDRAEADARVGELDSVANDPGGRRTDGVKAALRFPFKHREGHWVWVDSVGRVFQNSKVARNVSPFPGI